MKKQINPNTKAHLIRSAFYVLLLLAVCVIPFALAQRNTPKRSAATKSKVTATKVAATKAQLMAARERAKSVPASLIGKRQLAPQHKTASDQAQLRYDVRRAPSLPRVSQVPLRSSGPTGAGPISVPPRPKGVQAVLYDHTTTPGALLACPRRLPIFRPSAPILLTTLLCPEVRLGMWTRSTPMGFTSMAQDPPPIGMSSFTPTAVAFLVRKFTAR